MEHFCHRPLWAVVRRRAPLPAHLELRHVAAPRGLSLQLLEAVAAKVPGVGYAQIDMADISILPPYMSLYDMILCDILLSYIALHYVALNALLYDLVSTYMCLFLGFKMTQDLC